MAVALLGGAAFLVLRWSFGDPWLSRIDAEVGAVGLCAIGATVFASTWLWRTRGPAWAVAAALLGALVVAACAYVGVTRSAWWGLGFAVFIGASALIGAFREEQQDDTDEDEEIENIRAEMEQATLEQRDAERRAAALRTEQPRQY